jgi:hypothetical protein
MFGSRSLRIHLARGALGAAALSASVAWGEHTPWLLALTLPVAVIALRGCPMCWTVGLVGTLMAKLEGRPSDACVDGSCALPRADYAAQVATDPARGCSGGETRAAPRRSR